MICPHMQGAVCWLRTYLLRYMHQKFTRGLCLEKIGEMLYEGGSYVLIEVVPHREYIARHVKKDSKEKWCKNEFLLQVNDLADEFKCECEMFDHFGMLCIHALMVSFFAACYVCRSNYYTYCSPAQKIVHLRCIFCSL